MQKGVDITYVDFFPDDMRSDYGFKKPVIQYTCTLGRKTTLFKVQPGARA